MNQYAIASYTDSYTTAQTWHEWSGSREREATPSPQSRLRSRRTYTQFAHHRSYVKALADVSEAADPAASDPVPEFRHAVSDLTQTADETPAAADTVHTPGGDAQLSVEEFARERMLLLARKYANRGSVETLARIERLDALLSKIAPRIKDSQITALEETQALLQRGEAERAARTRRRAERKALQAYAELHELE